MSLEIQSPQLQLFNSLFIISLDLGYKTYDYLPDNHTELPFVYIGEQFSQDRANKSTVHGNIQQTIHVYGNHRQRRLITEMVGKLRYKIRGLKHTDSFNVSVMNMNDQTLLDNSTTTTLIHGILEVEFSFN